MSNNMNNENNVVSKLWVEKYRPQTIEDYVFKNNELKRVVQHIITTGEIPSLLLHGPAGTGKTSLINVILNSIPTIVRDDVMELNMSDEGVDAIREKVLPFITTIPFGSYKVIILEEFEMCSQKGQGSLKRIMEEYSSVARFILTSNEPNKILRPIRSRTQEIQIESHDIEQFMLRVLKILETENIRLSSEVDFSRVNKYIDACYPDFRKCINTLQQNCVNGEIIDLNSATSGTQDYKLQIINGIKNNNLNSVREMIVKNIREDEISQFFTYLYQNVDIWIPAGLDKDSADILRMSIILKIREGLVKDTLVSDRECNMSATLCDIQLSVNEVK